MCSTLGGRVLRSGKVCNLPNFEFLLKVVNSVNAVKHFFLTAMALEQLQSAGELEVRDEDIISCYECAGDIALWLITDQATSQRPTVTSQTMPLGRTLEIALQRAPVLLIKIG